MRENNIAPIYSFNDMSFWDALGECVIYWYIYLFVIDRLSKDQLDRWLTNYCLMASSYGASAKRQVDRYYNKMISIRLGKLK